MQKCRWWWSKERQGTQMYTRSAKSEGGCSESREEALQGETRVEGSNPRKLPPHRLTLTNDPASTPVETGAPPSARMLCLASNHSLSASSRVESFHQSPRPRSRQKLLVAVRVIPSLSFVAAAQSSTARQFQTQSRRDEGAHEPKRSFDILVLLLVKRLVQRVMRAFHFVCALNA